MSFLSVPLFLPLTGCFSQVSLCWKINACPISFSPPLSVSAVHRWGMKYRCLSPLGAVNAKWYLAITGAIVFVLSTYKGLYVVFWLMKCFGCKYTSPNWVNSWIPGYQNYSPEINWRQWTYNLLTLTFVFSAESGKNGICLLNCLFLNVLSLPPPSVCLTPSVSIFSFNMDLEAEEAQCKWFENRPYVAQ